MTNETSIIALPGKVTATKTGLVFTNGISYEEWEQLGDKLKQIEGAVQWWIGDWLNYGEFAWGEMYSQAVDETGYKYETVRQEKRVASEFQFGERSPNLSWTHHLYLADGEVTKKERRELIRKAEKEDWPSRKLREEVKQLKRAKKLPEATGELPLDVSLLVGDFREVLAELPKNSIDFIFTDPPYDEESIPLFGDLARLGARVLKPGGSLITYVGHYAVGKVFDQMENYLRFWWLLSVQHSGAAARLIGKNVFVEWKPMLWFVKDHRRDDTEWVADMVVSDIPTKDDHEWQQGYKEAQYYIDKLTLPGEVILDPFAGSGTTLISAYRLGRKSIGVEIDEQRADTARGHIQAECGLQAA